MKQKSALPAFEGGTPVRKNFLVFGSPDIGNEEIREVVDSLKSGWLGTGPKVGKFESQLAKYVEAKYALGLNSATAGLHLALIVCGIKEGDEVITSPMTFAATANVIEHVGAKPIFADIELASMNIDPKEIEKNITKKTKAIIPVHIAGRPCNMEKIMRIAKKYKLKVIEDAAHALGASYHGRKIGSIGDMSIFSFYVTKNLVTGEGGMITTNNQSYAEKTRVYSLHGMSKDAWKRYSDEGFKHYLIEVPGYKYNMTDIQASLGIHQLAKFDQNQKKRKENWKMYNQAFLNLPIITPSAVEPNTAHAYHLYTILVELDKLKVDRDIIQSAIHAENIGVGIHFISLHDHPYYKQKYGFKMDDFPNSEYISQRTISLPLSSKLTKRDVEDVILAVKKVLDYYKNNSHKSRKVSLPQAAPKI